MKYILEGDEKELGRVLREQRIRIGRGLIKITPISGTLVHEDYALKAIEAQQTNCLFLSTIVFHVLT